MYKKFWQYDAQYWFGQLNSSINGLSQKQADLILANSAHKKTESAFEKDIKLFIRQFESPMMLLLIGAVALSAFLGDYSDVFIILFIVLSTGLLSFFQERNAGKVVEKLQSMLSLKSTVLRDGKETQTDSDKVVAGDMILLKAGDMIPADCILIEENELHVNEASLTGESFPVKKEVGQLAADTELSKRYNSIWEGSNIVSGNAKALVINTGSNTVFGEIADSITKVNETAFEKGIKDFGYFLMKITLFLSIFILIINLLNHKNIVESALFALALAVGMAPELLPAITTIAMSAGAKRMLAKKVIVKKLSSIQNLGEVNLLCTDKTGTITEGVIKVAYLQNAFGEKSDFVGQLAYWNAALESGYENPIDAALKALPQYTTENVQKLGEVPYDFVRKRLSIALKNNHGNILVSKGAVPQVLSVCTNVQLADQSIADINLYLKQIEERFEQYGENGLRAIGVAFKNLDKDSITLQDENDMTFAGFILLEDPIKAGITETISELDKLKVGLKIITGDNKNVAHAIGERIGFKNPKIMTGQELANTSSEALPQLIKQVNVFAEVEPQQKEMIIRSLRKNFAVAYIGDGINDVSAINAADVGISVSNAVDVAREAADFVLMEKDLMVLADGMKEGRKTFANTLKYIFINTGSTFGNMFSVAFASLVLPFLPMLPKQILLTNFITDFPYLSVASDNVDEEQLDRPGVWNLKLIRNYMIVFGIHSSLFDIITFLTLLYVLKVKESAFQTGWFVESILTELFILFIIRTRKNFFKSQPSQSLLYLSLLGLIITIALLYMPFAAYLGLTPLPFYYLGMMLFIVLLYVITADWLKIWFFKKYKF